MHRSISLALLAILLAMSVLSPTMAAELQLLLPLNRVAYQTNEWIPISVVRNDAAPLSAGMLELRLRSEDGSVVSVNYQLKAVPVVGNNSRATEHYQINGMLLRPGKYLAEVSADGATTSKALEIYSHVRKTNYKLINWGRAKTADELIVQGEDSLGFNLFYAHYGGHDQDANIRAGVDHMNNCTQSGGHQMDLRMECDWSDPYVLQGGRARVVRQALKDRMNPNSLGVHFYDEPGLTWIGGSPHTVPSQKVSYKSAFGDDPIKHTEVNANDAATVEAWNQWASWKLGFMNAAWKDAQFGVSYVKPDFLSVTQSQYGFSAFTDGYAFNVARSLPVVSGHGGYDDWGPCYFNPSFTLEMGRARDLTKDCWYLPTWYGNTPWDRYRMEQYLSFITGIEGMMSPPDVEPATRPGAREGIVETNKLMQRLGTIFTTMPVTRPPVAMLYSISHLIDAQTKNITKVYYAHQDTHGLLMDKVYLAGQTIHNPFLPITDEDVADGTLLAYHQAVVLPAVDYLAPDVAAALEEFAAQGGLVLLTAESEIQLKGAIKLKSSFDFTELDKAAKAPKNEMSKYYNAGNHFKAVLPVALEIKEYLDKANISPVYACDNNQVIARRQSYGDIEYLFAVNAAYLEGSNQMNAITSTSATIALNDDGRPVYNALTGGQAGDFIKKGNKLEAQLRFGPGQMRAFARTARPIGGVQVSTPMVVRDYTSDFPLSLNISAMLVDEKNIMLSGSAPLEIRVTDPRGATRYHLYRATDMGVCRLQLPLAATDPAGAWKVTVKELLANTSGAATFALATPGRVTAVAGTIDRAVYFAEDRENVFRFFRVHKAISIVRGTGDYNAAAADRLAESLKPWGVTCTVVDAAEVNKPRPISTEEAPTWVGLGGNRVKPGVDNSPQVVGFDIKGPVVLMGNAKDNPLIAFMEKESFLPYKVTADFPGRGRGMVAWQMDAVGMGQESLALIAFDADGMQQAVGTTYELMAGMEPLMPRGAPFSASVTPATVEATVAEFTVAWSASLTDRAQWMAVDGGVLSVCALDGTLVTLDGNGKQLSAKQASAAEQAAGPKPITVAPAAMKDTLMKNRMFKMLATGNGLTAIAYWGGTLQLVTADGTVKAQQVFGDDIASLVFMGEKLAISMASGQLIVVNTD